MNEISFSVSPEQMAEIREYATRKGFSKPGLLARVALFQMMIRYPMGPKHGRRPADALAVQPTPKTGSIGAVGTVDNTVSEDA